MARPGTGISSTKLKRPRVQRPSWSLNNACVAIILRASLKKRNGDSCIPAAAPLLYFHPRPRAVARRRKLLSQPHHRATSKEGATAHNITRGRASCQAPTSGHQRRPANACRKSQGSTTCFSRGVRPWNNNDEQQHEPIIEILTPEPAWREQHRPSVHITSNPSWVTTHARRTPQSCHRHSSSHTHTQHGRTSGHLSIAASHRNHPLHRFLLWHLHNSRQRHRGPRTLHSCNSHRSPPIPTPKLPVPGTRPGRTVVCQHIAAPRDGTCPPHTPGLSIAQHTPLGPLLRAHPRDRHCEVTTSSSSDPLRVSGDTIVSETPQSPFPGSSRYAPPALRG